MDIKRNNQKGNRKQRRPMRDRVPEPVKIWKPTTKLGLEVQKGDLTDIEQVFDRGEKILEAEIVDVLLPDLEEELLLIGQAKGKFGGGQRRIFRQTQKKTMEGNKIQFLTCAVVGNKNGFVGVNHGKSKETVPARDKSKRKAKLNLIRIRRGCGSWECGCGEAHSVPFAITGKCGSATITLMPAPKGKGLCVEKECAKVLHLAGIKDVWSKTKGQTKTKLNLVKACVDALKNLTETKVRPNDIVKLGIVDGKLKEQEKIETPEEIIEEAKEQVEEPIKEEKTEAPVEEGKKEEQPEEVKQEK
jgi:small subunit ribosomal protein S5